MERHGLLEADQPARSDYHSRLLPGTADPLRLATALARAAPTPHVLYERAGTWSLATGAVWELILYADELHIRDADGWSVERVDTDPLQQLAGALARCPVAGSRAYGWVGFALSYLLHGMPAAAARQPLVHLFVPRSEVRISADAIDLRALDVGDLVALDAALTVAASADPVAGVPLTLTTSGHGEQLYRAAVTRAVRDIQDRRLQKVILSRSVPVEHDVDLFATYELGRRENTPARSYLLDLGDLRCAGFSPETVVEVAADGHVSTQPLAGTRALHGDPLLDGALRADLQEDAKEIFEHAISVKLACEELTAMCRPGSVQVDDFMTVQERGSVQHLASRVSGKLADGRNAWHALAGLFPAITASGVPKSAACVAIHSYEDEPRGLYSGAVLTVDADGSMDAALVLRSIFQQAGRTWLRAGAGIVEQSTPDREYEETAEKLRSISRFIVPAAEASHG